MGLTIKELNMDKSNEFKNDVLSLHKQGYTIGEITEKLADKYGVKQTKYGRSMLNFRSRINMCILRNKGENRGDLK